eukprot:5401555-Karenia_brevis.AAC.1
MVMMMMMMMMTMMVMKQMLELTLMSMRSDRVEPDPTHILCMMTPDDYMLSQAQLMIILGTLANL